MPSTRLSLHGNLREIFQSTQFLSVGLQSSYVMIQMCGLECSKILLENELSYKITKIEFFWRRWGRSTIRPRATIRTMPI